MTRTPTWTMSRAARDLRVRYPDLDQDWGISNADPARLAEFVRYYEQHAPTLDSWEVEFTLGELLLESANDALIEGPSDRLAVNAAVRLIAARSATAPTRALMEYWTTLDGLNAGQQNGGADDWPVAGRLREALAEAGPDHG